MSETVLLDVRCARCLATHDVYGEQDERGRYTIDPEDRRCPACDCEVVLSAKPRPSLA